MRFLVLVALLIGQARAPGRSDWIALAKGGFALPAGRTAAELLAEMNPLLAMNDPVLRDDVAYGAAERWILRDHRLPYRAAGAAPAVDA